MRKKIFWGVVFVVPSLLLPLMPALAQPNTAEPPALEGNLDADRGRCYDRLERDPRTFDPEFPDRKNKVMARVRLCSWLITYDPSRDGSVARDYGAAWVQTYIEPRNGYCVRQANTKIRLPHGEGLVSGRTPHRSVTLDAPRRKNVHLRLAPNGASAGTISQHFRLYPDELKVLYKENDKGRLYITRWHGRAINQTLAFAAGVKMSWDSAEGSPSFLPRLNYRFIIPDDKTERACG